MAGIHRRSVLSLMAAVPEESSRVLGRMAHRAAAVLRRRLRVVQRRKPLAARKHTDRAMPVARPSPMAVNAEAGAEEAVVPED